MVLFGGAFDPPTQAHIEVVQKLCLFFKGTPVRIIVQPCVRHNHGKSLGGFSHRLEMCDLAFSHLSPQVIVSDAESQMTEFKTFDVLEKMSKWLSLEKFALCIGGDNYMGLRNWYRGDDILRKYPLVVFSRGGCKSVDVRHGDQPQHILIEGERKFSDLSSTIVRKKLARGEVFGLTERVSTYIVDNQLYGISSQT